MKYFITEVNKNELIEHIKLIHNQKLNVRIIVNLFQYYSDGNRTITMLNDAMKDKKSYYFYCFIDGKNVIHEELSLNSYIEQIELIDFKEFNRINITSYFNKYLNETTISYECQKYNV